MTDTWSSRGPSAGQCVASKCTRLLSNLNPLELPCHPCAAIGRDLSAWLHVKYPKSPQEPARS